MLTTVKFTFLAAVALIPITATAQAIHPDGTFLAKADFTVPLPSGGTGPGTFAFISHYICSPIHLTPFFIDLCQRGTFTFITVFETAGAGPGFPPPYRSNTPLTGEWTREGYTVTWRGMEIVSENQTGGPPLWFYIIGHGSHVFDPADPNHPKGNFSTVKYACPADANNITGFRCPTWDEVDSGTLTQLAAFPPATFTFTRITSK